MQQARATEQNYYFCPGKKANFLFYNISSTVAHKARTRVQTLIILGQKCENCQCLDPCPDFVCDGRAYVIKPKICFFSGAKKIILFGGPGLVRFPGICNFVQISGKKTLNLMPFLRVCSYTSKILSKVRLCTKN